MNHLKENLKLELKYKGKCKYKLSVCQLRQVSVIYGVFFKSW